MCLANLSRGKPTATLLRKAQIFYEGKYKAYAIELHMLIFGNWQTW